MTHDQRTIDMLASRAAIHDLAMAYCRGLDRADAALLASVFWEDGIMDAGLMTAPAPQFAQAITAYCRENMDGCFHAISNEWVRIDGDRAVGELYVVAHVSAGGQDVTTGGRYLDRYERRGGVWKIALRTFVADWNEARPASMALDPIYEAGRNRGGWGDADPVAALWRGA